MVSLLQEAQANHVARGFAHTTSADNCQASECASPSAAEQNTFIFYDGTHFTECVPPYYRGTCRRDHQGRGDDHAAVP